MSMLRLSLVFVVIAIVAAGCAAKPTANGRVGGPYVGVGAGVGF